MSTMPTDREIEARFRRESLVFSGVLLAMLLIVSLGTTLIIATPAWQSRLDTLVTSGESKTAIVMHMAIAALPALFCLILLPRLLRRDELRCGHCARRLGSVAISTGNCGGCGRPAVVRTGACADVPRYAGLRPARCADILRYAGLWPARCADLLRYAGLWPARRYAGVRADGRARGPRTNGRAGGPRTGEAPIEGAGPVLTAAELNAAVRRALPFALAGIAAMIAVLVLGAVFFGSSTPAGTRLLILLLGIALMLTGIVIADRRVPRCPSCRKSLVPTWFPVTTGRCRGCGTEVLRVTAVPVTVDATSRIDRDGLNRAVDLHRRVGLLPCVVGFVVALGLIALLWNGFARQGWWAGAVVMVAMLGSIVASDFLLRRAIVRRSRGHGACPACRAALFAFRDGADAVGATGRCWRCGARVMECPALQSAGT